MLKSLLLPGLLCAAALAPAAAGAQAVVQPLAGNGDADRLAATMRRVAAAPTDVGALAEAGELSLRLDDASGAASLFARAEKIDPRNGRVKAGMGSILVRAERPGEALRYFNQAEGYGWPAARFASDRGLAYDLTGQNERAQRDYRLALRGGTDDETLRRYALSLAVSGRRGPALEVLDPLLRRRDRGAWRIQAFVLALTGDPDGADRIAGTMMPAAAAGLAPFFRRLPSLAPTDRAFAAHFGELRPTPERVADARLAPALAPLPPEPDPFRRGTQLASAAPPAAARVPARESGRRSRRRDRQAEPPAATRAVPAGRVALASAEPVPVPAQPAAAEPTSSLPPAITLARRLGPPPRTAPVQVASAPAPSVAPTPTPTPAPAPVPATRPSPPPAVEVAAAPPAPVAPARDTDSVLARIVASITIPASELEAAGDPALLAAARPPVRRGRTARAAPVPPALAAAQREAAREEADRAAAVRTIRAARPAAEAAAARAEADEPRPARGRRDRRAAEPVELADAAPARAARTRGARAKPAPRETAAARAARTEPERIWVQVAGGANEGDLGKAWGAARRKAPALAGRQGYTTPSRATNRVVTGPFKSDAEARAFVNKLRSQGVGAFSFTSDAGQKMARLPTAKN